MATAPNPATVARRLRTLGYNPLRSQDRRRRSQDGIKVEKPIVASMGTMVTIQNFNNTLDLGTSSQKLLKDLESLGYTLNCHSQGADQSLITFYIFNN